jgi:transcriptional regulator with XRE-family HTH domain
MPRNESSSEPAAADHTELVDVGRRIREYRLMRHATLRQVAAKAGVSEGFLSQLERGLTSASLNTLRQIAEALGLQMVDLFDSGSAPTARVLTRASRPTLQFGHRLTKQLLTPKPFRHLEVFVGIFEPGGTTGPKPLVHGHSQELLLVLEGSVRLTLGDQNYQLDQGDSINYDSGTPHRVSTAGGKPAQLLWIISPPSY